MVARAELKGGGDPGGRGADVLAASSARRRRRAPRSASTRARRRRHDRGAWSGSIASTSRVSAGSAWKCRQAALNHTGVPGRSRDPEDRRHAPDLDRVGRPGARPSAVRLQRLSSHASTSSYHAVRNQSAGDRAAVRHGHDRASTRQQRGDRGVLGQVVHRGPDAMAGVSPREVNTLSRTRGSVLTCSCGATGTAAPSPHGGVPAGTDGCAPGRRTPAGVARRRRGRDRRAAARADWREGVGTGGILPAGRSTRAAWTRRRPPPVNGVAPARIIGCARGEPPGSAPRSPRRRCGR